MSDTKIIETLNKYWQERKQAVPNSFRVSKLNRETSNDIKNLINSQVLEAIEKIKELTIDANYYVPNSPDDTYVNGEVVRIVDIEAIEKGYKI